MRMLPLTAQWAENGFQAANKHRSAAVFLCVRPPRPGWRWYIAPMPVDRQLRPCASSALVLPSHLWSAGPVGLYRLDGQWMSQHINPNLIGFTAEYTPRNRILPLIVCCSVVNRDAINGPGTVSSIKIRVTNEDY
jgi:hypothetical protein